MKLVLAEKSSVAQSIAKVLGVNKREDGFLTGKGYIVSWCVGHLVEQAQPESYDERYSKWKYADLPIFPSDWKYEVSDKPYDKLGFSIHNYFFAKALVQVRPGGVVAFVTSRYTMDSKNSDARRYLAQRAELLGAIRLPNDAFKKNAGAEVVSDIIFLQKRDHPIDLVPDWVHLNRTEDGHIINSYFVDHPEMVLGELVEESTAYGMDITVRTKEGMELADLLKEAVSNIQGTYQAVELPEADSRGKQPDTIPASPDVKNYSYAVVEGEVYFRENSIMRHVELNEKAKERVRGMVELRGIVNQLIEYQLEDYPDQMIRQKQVELNDAYDAFTAKHGLLNNRANGQVFADDSSYYLLCSLENVDDEGNLKSKADMFTKRTIKPDRRVTSVDTPSEALAISIGERGKVDLPYMAQLLGTPEEYDAITRNCVALYSKTRWRFALIRWQAGFLQALAFVTFNATTEQKLITRSQKAFSQESIKDDKDIMINLFGKLEIYTSKGADRNRNKFSKNLSFPCLYAFAWKESCSSSNDFGADLVR